MNLPKKVTVAEPANFSPKSFKLNIMFNDINADTPRPSRFGPMQIASFLSNLQSLYQYACKAFDMEPHQLKITNFSFPEGEWHFYGIGDAAVAVRDTLLVAPDFVADMFDKDAVDQNTSIPSTGHLEIIKPIYGNLSNIDVSSRKEYIEFTLNYAIGANKNLQEHINATECSKPSKSVKSKGRKSS